MNRGGEKHIVVRLPGIPVKDRRLCGAKAAGKASQSDHGNRAGRRPRCEAKPGVGGKWINAGSAGRRSRIFAAVTQPERIEEVRGEHMVFLQPDELASRP